MKIGIVGIHPPVANVGFNFAMTIYAAKWLAEFGHEVTVYLTRFDEAVADRPNLNMESPYGNFMVRLYEDNVGVDDVIIWQRRDPRIYQALFPVCGKESAVAKNFATLHREKDEHIRAQLDAFDMAMLALKSDFYYLQQHYEGVGKFCYAPRGADPELLYPEKPKVFTILVDNAVPEAEYKVFEGIRMFKRKTGIPVRVLHNERHGPYTDVITDSTGVRSLFGYYEILRGVHVYATIEYALDGKKETLHMFREDERPLMERRRLYELTNVEAQMAGAFVVGFRGGLIENIHLHGVTAFEAREDTPESYANAIIAAYEASVRSPEKPREFALKYYSWENCIRLWEKGLLRI
jgi:hypothetical protein